MSEKTHKMVGIHQYTSFSK